MSPPEARDVTIEALARSPAVKREAEEDWGR